MSLPGSKQHILIPRRHRTVFFKPEFKETNKMKHAKALNPFHLLLKPISQKCLDLALSSRQLIWQGSSSDSDSEMENNKSCHCRDCGHQSKKMKHMKRKFRHFSPVMHAVMRERRKKLKQKFRNAVYVIMWMQRLAIQRKKKKMLVRKIVRMKTKVLDTLPEPQPLPIEQQIIYIEVRKYLYQPTQPVQVQMIDFKHKQRQSIVNYLHNKLHDHEIHSNNYQLSLPKLKQQSILSQSHSKFLTKTLRTQGDEVETPLRTNLHSLVNKASPPKQSTISPYLKQPQMTLRVLYEIAQIRACSEQSIHCKQLQSHRNNQKSQSQDIFGRNKFHQRKLTSSNTPF